MPSGVLSCPNPNELCAVAGGYAYIIDTLNPERSTHIPLKPVVRSIRSHPERCSSSQASTPSSPGARTARPGAAPKLSWEGIRITGIKGNTLHGTGWNLLTDRELPFALDLRTGHHQGVSPCSHLPARAASIARTAKKLNAASPCFNQRVMHQRPISLRQLRLAAMLRNHHRIRSKQSPPPIAAQKIQRPRYIPFSASYGGSRNTTSTGCDLAEPLQAKPQPHDPPA